jgi:hypothetical protein
MSCKLYWLQIWISKGGSESGDGDLPFEAVFAVVVEPEPNASGRPFAPGDIERSQGPPNDLGSPIGATG